MAVLESVQGKLATVIACLAFAVAFGGIGAGASYVAGATIYDGWRAKEWVRVKAQVESASAGEVSYRYRFGEREYVGNRLGASVIGGTDNIDSWHDEMEARNVAALTEKRPITVFVNPAKPSESMADREIRWGWLMFLVPFALGFGGVGVGALWVLGHTLIGERPQARKRVVSSNAGGQLLGIWIFAFFWSVIAFPIAILAVPQIVRDGEWVGLLILLFPLVGLFLLWAAIKGTYDYLRRGGASLVLSDDEPHAGGSVEGHIGFARGVKTGETFRVRLACLTATRSGNSWNERTLWEKEVTARAHDTGAGARIAFRFEVPDNLPPTSGETSRGEDRHRWELAALSPDKAASARHGFQIEMGPSRLAPAMQASSTEALEDEPMPVALGPGFENIEKMLNGAGVKLTHEQRATFTSLTPEQRAAAAKLVKWAPMAKKVVIAIVVLLVIPEVVGVFAAFF